MRYGGLEVKIILSNNSCFHRKCCRFACDIRLVCVLNANNRLIMCNTRQIAFYKNNT
jgi:hypothetical protein